MRVDNFISAFFLLIFFLIPIHAIDITTISFSQNITEILPCFTADKTKIFVTHFSAEKNETKEVPIYITSVSNLSEVVVFIKYNNKVIKPDYISDGNFNISYMVEDEIKINLNLNETFTGDFLLAKIFFKAIGDGGESTSITIEVDKFLDNNSNEIIYLTLNGMFSINLEYAEETKDSEGGVDSSLEGLINSDNPAEYAEKNNLEFEDGKVKVVMETNDSKEEKFVSIDELNNLTNNETITRISPYREIPVKEIIIILAIIILLIILILKLRR
ncbi:MAG: hypothetical protein KAT28_01980 [Candidatus Aenigmarchaeota archaeon]|nr:hypothetical protein [Candidatus Aenigmarchaeota archaeon]